MANRSMIAKAERAKRQLREIASSHAETDRLLALTQPSKAELRALIATLTSNIDPKIIKRIPCQGIMPREAFSVTGKGNRTLAKRTYGNYERVGTQGVVVHACEGDRLIQRAK